MKSIYSLAIASLLTVIAVFSHGGFALADSADPPPGRRPTGDQVDVCIRKCFEQYLDDLRECKRSCRVCNFSIVGICLSRSTDDDCLSRCRNAAWQTWVACRAACD